MIYNIEYHKSKKYLFCEAFTKREPPFLKVWMDTGQNQKKGYPKGGAG